MSNAKTRDTRKGKIEDESSGSLTPNFSKRRDDLFREARDLCSSCDANIAIVTFSPEGRPHAFGHPSVDSVFDRFLRQDEHGHDNLEEGEKNVGSVQVLKAEGEEQEERIAWEKSIEDMSLEELEEYKDSLMDLRNKVARRLQDAKGGEELTNDNIKPYQLIREN